MKIADLLDEHGLKLFKNADLVFGIAWGAFGSLLVLDGGIVATVVMAMNVAFIVRNRLDYRNHRVAATMVIASGIVSQSIPAAPFEVFLAVFVLFGRSKDLKMQGFAAHLTELMLYYPIPTLTYCLIYGHWELFWVFTVYTIAYDMTKAIAKRRPWYREDLRPIS